MSYACAPRSRLAILPSHTHYDIFGSPDLPNAVIPFLDTPPTQPRRVVRLLSPQRRRAVARRAPVPRRPAMLLVLLRTERPGSFLPPSRSAGVGWRGRHDQRPVTEHARAVGAPGVLGSRPAPRGDPEYEHQHGYENTDGCDPDDHDVFEGHARCPGDGADATAGAVAATARPPGVASHAVKRAHTGSGAEARTGAAASRAAMADTSLRPIAAWSSAATMVAAFPNQPRYAHPGDRIDRASVAGLALRGRHFGTP